MKFLKFSFLNLKQFVTKSTFIFVLLILTQIISVTGILFSYGIAQNTTVKIKEIASENKKFNVDLLYYSDTETEQVAVGYSTDVNGVITYDYEERPKTLYDKCVSAKYFKEKISEINKLYDNKYMAFSCVGYTANPNSEQSYEFIAADINKQYYEDFESYGRDFTEDEENQGAKLLKIGDMYEFDVGDTVDIGGEKFTVIDKSKPGDVQMNYEGLTMPYKAMQDDFLIKSFTFELVDVPNEELTDEINAKITELFNPTTVSEPALPDLMENQFNNMSLALSAIIIMLITFNITCFYAYILKLRQDWLAVLRLCGCKKSQASIIYLFEMLIIILISCISAYLLFKYILFDYILKIYPHFEMFYDVGIYALMIGLYILFSLLFLISSVAVEVKNSAVAMKRGV